MGACSITESVHFIQTLCKPNAHKNNWLHQTIAVFQLLYLKNNDLV